MNLNRNKPAYPVVSGDTVHEIGLTKREYFTIQAIAGMLANPSLDRFGGNNKALCECAVKIADALIDSLETQKQQI